MENKKQAKESIRANLIQAINNGCNCSFESSYLSREMVSCGDGQTSTDVLYTANVTSPANHTSEDILRLLKQWLETEPTVILVMDTAPNITIRLVGLTDDIVNELDSTSTEESTSPEIPDEADSQSPTDDLDQTIDAEGIDGESSGVKLGLSVLTIASLAFAQFIIGM